MISTTVTSGSELAPDATGMPNGHADAPAPPNPMLTMVRISLTVTCKSSLQSPIHSGDVRGTHAESFVHAA